MRRFIMTLSVIILLPLIAQAYTLVLKDGRRVEVREKYRIVSDIAVFTLPEGNRFSVSLDKINIAATELANGESEGTFVKNTTEPLKVTDKTNNAKSIIDQDPIASSRPIGRKITNSDFDRYKARREEMLKDSTNRANAKAATQPNTADVPNDKTERDTATFLAEHREKEKNREEYWRGRSRALLTELRVEEEQINSLQGQIEDSRRFQPPASTVSVYSNPAPYVYPYPGVRIGGVPIGIGGQQSSGGSVVIINQDQNSRGRTLQERLVDLRLKYQETLIRYQEMCEEGRRDGAFPGWLR